MLIGYHITVIIIVINAFKISSNFFLHVRNTLEWENICKKPL